MAHVALHFFTPGRAGTEPSTPSTKRNCLPAGCRAIQVLSPPMRKLLLVQHPPRGVVKEETSGWATNRPEPRTSAQPARGVDRIRRKARVGNHPATTRRRPLNAVEELNIVLEHLIERLVVVSAIGGFYSGSAFIRAKWNGGWIPNLFQPIVSPG